MADAYQILPDDSGNTGKKIDCDLIVVAGQQVYRQRVQALELQALLTQLIALQPTLQSGAVPVALQATGDMATATLQGQILTALQAPLEVEGLGQLATAAGQAQMLAALQAPLEVENLNTLATAAVQAQILAELQKFHVSAVRASNGTLVPVDSLAQTLGYDGSGNLQTTTVSYNGTSYVQTLTYTAGNLTGVSAWVAQ